MSKHFFLTGDSSDYSLILDINKQITELEKNLEIHKKKFLKRIRSELVKQAPFFEINVTSTALNFGGGYLADFIEHILFQDTALFFGLCDSASYPFVIKTEALLIAGIKQKKDLEQILEKISQENNDSGYEIILINDSSYEELIFKITFHSAKLIENN